MALLVMKRTSFVNKTINVLFQCYRGLFRYKNMYLMFRLN